MKRSTRLALAVAATLTLSARANPRNPPNRPVNAPALAPRLHIQSFTILSPACNKPPQFRIEIRNLTGTAFEGNKTMSPTDGPAVIVTNLAGDKHGFLQGLPGVGGGMTLPVTLTIPDRTTACPSDNCWEVRLFRSGPGGPELAEWDGKTARICAKTSCNPHASKLRTPCAFEIYSPMPAFNLSR